MRNWKDFGRRSAAAGPAALVALGWVALWFLWPHGELAPHRIRRRSAPHLRYAGRQDGYERPAVASDVAVIPSSALRRLEDRDDLTMLLYKPAAGGALERAAAQQAGSVCATQAPAIEFQGIRVEAYRPFWDFPAAFGAVTSRPPALVMELAPSLQGRGFRLPDAPPEIGKTGTTGWQAVFQVECGTDGRVEHVFLEQGTGNAALDGALSKWLDRGAVTAGTGVCSGRIVVNFGEP